MKRVMLVTVSLFLLTSCGVDVDEDWYGDPRYTDAERAEIQAGSDWIHERAGLPPPIIRWDGGDAHKVTLVRGPGPSNDTGQCQKRYEGHGYVYANPDVAGPFLRAIVAHEMGHCVLDFDDRYGEGRPQSDGIMGLTTALSWTESEEAQCRVKKTCAR